MYLQPIKDIHFKSTHITYQHNYNQGNIYYILIFIPIGIFILLLAGINYINLTTALAAVRAREISVRKIAGGNSVDIMKQIIGESMIMILFAIIVALVLVEIALPLFQNITGIDYGGINNNIDLFLIFFLGAFVFGFLTSLYPALYLSRIKAAYFLIYSTIYIVYIFYKIKQLES